MKIRNIIILSLFFALLGFAYTKKAKIQRYFAEERYHRAFIMLGIEKKSYSSDKDFLSIFKQEGLDYFKADEEIASTSLKKLLETKEGRKLKVPTITHHVYFTSKIKPTTLPEFYIEKMKANFSKLNELDSNWQHYIWTNHEALFPEDLLKIKGVTIKNIQDFKDTPLYNYLLDTIEKGNDNRAFFMEASDMTRVLALQKFGGIYTDIDYEIYNAKILFELMKNFDFIGGREWTILKSYYGNSFMVAKPNHPVINEIVNRLTIYDLDPKNLALPDYIKYPYSFGQKLYINSPPLLTVAYFKKNNIDGNNDIILPSWMVFNVEFAHQKNGKCKSTLVSKDEFNYKNNILPKLINDFTVNQKIEDNHPTRKDIYYSNKDKDKFPIIGADMFCGTWSTNMKEYNYHYWNWPFSLFLRQIDAN